jgi:hypothetical protein
MTFGDAGAYERVRGTVNGDGGSGMKTARLGVSQCVIRDFVGQGFDQDEGNRKILDGVLTHISGVGRLLA